MRVGRASAGQSKIAVAAHERTGLGEGGLRLRGDGCPTVDHRGIGRRAGPAVAIAAFLSRNGRRAEGPPAANHAHGGDYGQSEKAEGGDEEPRIAPEAVLAISQVYLDVCCNLTP